MWSKKRNCSVVDSVIVLYVSGGLSGESRQKSFEPYIKPPDNGYSSADVWFKAATIAVPICGAVILFALIALAIRILRNEAQSSSDYKLG